MTSSTFVRMFVGLLACLTTPSAYGQSPRTISDERVEAACGQCLFGLRGNSCDLAIRIDGEAMFVDGSGIDDHGDAHAADGLCNAVRTAVVSGQIKESRFVATAFRLLPVGDTHQDEAAPWYEEEIAAFERADTKAMPAPGGVLFTGSSSVRKWRTLAGDMTPMPVINRGFGGSRTHEVLAVFDRIVTPYRPSVIVYYCGDNDLGSENTDSQSAAAGFIEFAERVRAQMPGTYVLYMSIKPSLDRWANWPAMAEASRLVREYCETSEHAEFVDLGTCLLGDDGRPDPALFEDDGLHVNADGYERWTAILRPRVIRAWERRTDD